MHYNIINCSHSCIYVAYLQSLLLYLACLRICVASLIFALLQKVSKSLKMKAYVLFLGVYLFRFLVTFRLRGLPLYIYIYRQNVCMQQDRG